MEQDSHERIAGRETAVGRRSARSVVNESTGEETMNPANAGRSHRAEVIERAEFVCQPGKLEGEALERALEARALRAHLHEKEAYANWKEGRAPEPDIAFWTRNDEP